MKAFVISEYAHHSNIPLTLDAPDPVFDEASDNLLVDVHSAGLNFFDILQAQGRYQTQPPRPFILGTEFAGTVAAAPAGSPFKPGDRVFGSAQGSLAERVLAKPELVLPLPDALSFDQGAGLYVTYPTSYEALVGRAKLQPGEWVLVLAAAGGVGIAATQIAKALGARVIAAASPNKLEIARVAGGADVVVDYTDDGWQKYVMHITGGRGVDVIYDPVGMVKDALKCIAWGGRVLVVGFAGGAIEQLPLNLVLLKNVSVVGIFWGSYTTKNPKRFAEVWQELLSLFASGKLKPVQFTGDYTLDTLGTGLDDLERRRTWGKAVVRVRQPYVAGKL
ncbi:NAD-P-binding protein [Russula compacta]|nr:NAD-P-binding protein [Russula compacta]